MTPIIPIWNRGKRTSRFVILFRAYCCAFIFAIPWFFFMSKSIWDFVYFFFFTYLFFIIPSQWAIAVLINVAAFLLYCNEPGYWKRKASGHDEFFDLCVPWPINPDSWGLRLSGIPEPKYETEPPEDWLIQCHTCGARNPDEATSCWYCHIEFYELRTVPCPRCQGYVKEPYPGCLDEENGMLCPYCRQTIRG